MCQWRRVERTGSSRARRPATGDRAGPAGSARRHSTAASLAGARGRSRRDSGMRRRRERRRGEGRRLVRCRPNCRRQWAGQGRPRRGRSWPSMAWRRGMRTGTSLARGAERREEGAGGRRREAARITEAARDGGEGGDESGRRHGARSSFRRQEGDGAGRRARERRGIGCQPVKKSVTKSKPSKAWTDTRAGLCTCTFFLQALCVAAR
jgi:hypothetical protein